MARQLSGNLANTMNLQFLILTLLESAGLPSAQARITDGNGVAIRVPMAKKWATILSANTFFAISSNSIDGKDVAVHYRDQADSRAC